MSDATDRRGLLTRLAILSGGTGLLSAVLLWPRRTIGKLRPPGARPNGKFEALCIRCFRCAEVCPPKAIRFETSLDPRTSDLPQIDAKTRACTLCMKCTEVCPTGALETITPDLATISAKVRMGTPVLDREACLPWAKHGVCRACWYACPLADRAIVLGGPLLGPVFRAEQCVGCGLCEEACPDDVHAIHIEPLDATRAAPRSEKRR
ncbi:4Fe-4S dicluster domain-containing protein [Myxococcota bacterium]|nr:4Fe-4S dicluster domain-containing protein [Myxococcota bacterium]